VIPDVSQYDSMDGFLTMPIAITKPRNALISWWFTGFRCVDLACVDRFSLFWHWFAYLLICKMGQWHKSTRRRLRSVSNAQYTFMKMFDHFT
jgi:hypothetical protein